MSTLKNTYKYLDSLDYMNVPLAKIMTPVGMNFEKWQEKKDKYIGGNPNEKMTARDNPLLNNYLRYTGENELKLGSMIPLGVAIYLYNDFNNKFKLPKKRKHDDGENFEISINNHDISKEYAKYAKVDLDDLHPSTQVPFSILVGRDIFNYNLHKLKQ